MADTTFSDGEILSGGGESDLSLGLTEINAEIAAFAGYGRDSTAWSAKQLAAINAARKAGLRMFLMPPPLPGEALSHEWRFLRPTATLTTVADQGEYALPDDYGSIIGDLVFPSTQPYGTVRVAGTGIVLGLRQQQAGGGIPRVAAIRPISPIATPSRYELLLHPIPNGVYSLCYRYNVIVRDLSESAPYPPGGMHHGDTILAACKAAADLQFSERRGEQWVLWLERLAASVARDRASEPDFHGYNGDRSSGRDSMPYRCATRATVEGQVIYEA